MCTFGPTVRIVWVRDHSVKICDPEGKPMFIQGVMTDITMSNEAELRMEHLAFHDAFTGLPNRVCSNSTSPWRWLVRAATVPPWRTRADLDDFKPVNDTHGHATGDEMLRQVGARLRLAVRETDYCVARQGGDEFLVLIADLPPGVEMVDATTTVSSVMDRIHDVVAQPFAILRGEPRDHRESRLSIFPRDAETTEGPLRVADEEMYRRKAENTRLEA